MKTTHTTAQSALATSAHHFVKVAGVITAFTNEDECWSFHQFENIVVGSAESSGRAKYFTRSELAA